MAEPSNPSPPFGISIWWESDESNRVKDDAVANIVNGWLRLPEPINVTLLVPPPDQAKILAQVDRANPRLKVLPRPILVAGSPLLTATLSTIWCQAQRGRHVLSNWRGALKAVAKTTMKEIASRSVRLLKRSCRGKMASFFLLVAGTPLALIGFVAIWAGLIVMRVLSGLLHGLFFPYQLVERLAKRADLENYQAPGDSKHKTKVVPSAQNEETTADESSQGFNLSDLAPYVVADIQIVFCARRLPHAHGAIALLVDASSPPPPVFGSKPLDGVIVLTNDALANRERWPAKVTRTVAPAAPNGGRTWQEVSEQVLMACREIVQNSKWEAQLDQHFVEPWPDNTKVPATLRDPYRLMLFLQTPYGAGVWEATKDLIHDLVEVNRERGQLHLIVGLHELQHDTRSIFTLDGEIEFCRLRMNPINRREIGRMCGSAPHWLEGRTEERFSFFSGAAQAALSADAWFGLVDRFPLPLLPARPYGIIVYDMIQRRVPDGFNPLFFEDVARGMAPTAKGANLVLVTSPQTRDDVVAEYGLDPSRVHLAPLSCNPSRRFDHVERKHIMLPRRPFILSVTNWARHKGSQVLLRGFARLREQLGKDTPMLVMCGWGTHTFSPSCPEVPAIPNAAESRRLVKELKLEKDTNFLGFIDDGMLLDLYHRCKLVVNPALYDNGSFSLPEAAYFGKPTVSADYPAAEFLCRRFGVDVTLFSTGDSDACAKALYRGLQSPRASLAEQEVFRSRLNDPEFSSRRYAERVYDALVKLGEQGRQHQHRYLLNQCA